MSIPPQIGSSHSAGKKLGLSIGFIIISIGYALWIHTGGTPSLVGIPIPQSSSKSYKETSAALLQTLSEITGPTTSALPSTTTVVAPTSVQSQPKMGPMMQTNTGLYKNGSYIGSITNAYYGSVQVNAIIQNGAISDVQFLQYPSDRSTSRYINSQAMPLLKQEAIQAQNAQVNGVSGATFTSQAFIQSLSSALALAKN